MTRISHRFYIIILTAMTVLTVVVVTIKGFSYYNLPIEERFYHSDHTLLKPGGVWGHGLGIAGSLAMIMGITLYMTRKRWKFMSRWGLLRHWLEFHIFLCTIGPFLVLFHTSFKFGGIVAVSFWSMVAVFLSGIAGRFIYLQIPRSIEGNELSLNELEGLKQEMSAMLSNAKGIDADKLQGMIDTSSDDLAVAGKGLITRTFYKYFRDRRVYMAIKKLLRSSTLDRISRKKILRLVKDDISLRRKIERLGTMQKLFRYWHVAHLPFALVMLIIMIIHVGVTIVFGYKWIF